MTSEQARKLMSAIQSADITQYSFNTDVTTAYYNDGKTSFVVPDYTIEGVHAFKKNGFGGSHTYFPNEKKCCYYFSDFGDIHEFRTAGTVDEIKAFMDALEIDLTDDQIKILYWMQGSTNDIKPLTGDYKFIPKSPEAVEAMTEEEREQYEAELKKYELRKAGIDGKASISIQMG